MSADQHPSSRPNEIPPPSNGRCDQLAHMARYLPAPPGSNNLALAAARSVLQQHGWTVPMSRRGDSRLLATVVHAARRYHRP